MKQKYGGLVMERRLFLKGLVTGVAFLSVPRLAQASKDEKIYRLKDPQHPTLLEKKHVPAIIAPEEVKPGEWFEVKVKVGYLVTHPSTPKHWITEIYLLCDGEKIAEVEYPRGGVAASEATFKIRLEHTARLEAIEHCNLHGTWIGEPVIVRVKA